MRGRKKEDGRGRLGGRKAGTPNKVTGTVKEWIAQLIDKNRTQIEQDLASLEPKDRLMILEKLMQYVVPKQQSVGIGGVMPQPMSMEEAKRIIRELGNLD